MAVPAFAGFPARASEWFASMLGEDDWAVVAARADEHEALVRAPMVAMCESLADEFGPAHVWHLHRSPWLWSHQVATVSIVDNIGLWVMLDIDALYAIGGWWTGSSEQVARYRTMQISCEWPAGPWLTTRVPLSRVRDMWRRMEPLTLWLSEHVGSRRR